MTEAIFRAAVARFAVAYPSSPIHTLGKNQLWDLVCILDEEAKKAAIIPAGQEQVRVMRLYVFEGPRERVEQQILRSLPDGTKDDFRQGSVKIHVATIGTFPEVLQPKPAAPPVPPPPTETSDR